MSTIIEIFNAFISTVYNLFLSVLFYFFYIYHFVLVHFNSKLTNQEKLFFYNDKYRIGLQALSHITGIFDLNNMDAQKRKNLHNLMVWLYEITYKEYTVKFSIHNYTIMDGNFSDDYSICVTVYNTWYWEDAWSGELQYKRSMIGRYIYRKEFAFSDFNKFWTKCMFFKYGIENRPYYKAMLFVLIQYAYKKYIVKEYPEFVHKSIIKLGL